MLKRIDSCWTQIVKEEQDGDRIRRRRSREKECRQCAEPRPWKRGLVFFNQARPIRRLKPNRKVRRRAGVLDSALFPFSFVVTTFVLPKAGVFSRVLEIGLAYPVGILSLFFLFYANVTKPTSRPGTLR